MTAGQALVRLDDTQARAALGQLRSRHLAAAVTEARLLAERDQLGVVEFPRVLRQMYGDVKAEEAAATERSIFEAGRKALKGRAGILEQRIAQFEREIEGLNGEIASEDRQLELIGQELTGLEQLRKRKLASMQRLLELQRLEAEIQGSRSRHVADIARAKQNIAEERLKILELDTQRVNEVVQELRDVQNLLLDLSERVRAATDVVRRTVIVSPLRGTIVGLGVHTVGGVVAPGESLMDIVPLGDRLIVQAKVKPEDIDSVHPGLTAQVALTAFNRRNVSPMVGTVTSVSADRLADPRTGQPYFLARISLPDQPAADYVDLELYPGMQAEVMIVTGERTALAYLFRPVVRSFGRALRED